jgi:protein-S-isoprenylcysteine O-methyltransferase Ste14
MPSVVVILRVLSLLAIGACVARRSNGGDRAPDGASSEGRGSRWPVAINFASFAVFYPVLITASAEAEGPIPLLLSITGSAIAVGGGVLFRRSRAYLGPAWSLAPRAGEQTGVVTTGPYRLVRHPIYLALCMVTAGQAVAFGNAPALLIFLAAVLPSFLWRAHVEERLLTRAFGDRYLAYRERTKMIIPYVV